ncbi:MAG: hypothetical protein IPM22_03665 [Betaproteobacteria bacterium]|nr:hypothetical protein [Betaproteobacteria bacterium]
MRFRRSLLRDAAYEGLPYKLRRQLHGAVATRMERELAQPEEEADLLSLHFLVAGEHRAAWRYATIAAKNAQDDFAFVEAARMYARALEAGRRLHDVPQRELASVHESLADCWYRVGEFPKAVDGYSGAADRAERPAAGFGTPAQALQAGGEARPLRAGAALGRACGQGGRRPQRR